jgi:DNA-binding HxlR family transcriptional regulator
VTTFNDSYAQRILIALQEHDRLSYNNLHRCVPITESTFASTLKKLRDAKQIKREVRITYDDKVTSEYFLTTDTRLKLLWGINQKIETARETRDYSYEPIHDKKSKEKALLLITHHAAFGYEYIDNKNPFEVELGDVAIVSPNDGRIEQHYLHLSKKPGVSIDDLINKIPGINRAAIFTYIGYSEPELKTYFRLLIKRNPPILKALQGYDGRVTRYGIANKDLEVFIMKCWVMFYMVTSRMEDTWKYIRWPNADSNETKWFVMFFGPKRTEDLIKMIEKKRNELGKKNEKEKQDFISHIYDQIKHNDINIIASYKELLSDSYSHIRKKYRLVVNLLLNFCYPDFIRALHRNNEL